MITINLGKVSTDISQEKYKNDQWENEKCCLISSIFNHIKA